MAHSCDLLLLDARVATMADNGIPYGIIEPAALAIKHGKITFIDSLQQLPQELKKNAKAIIPLNGRWITPGLIDCHNHFVYAGSRSCEFEAKLNGKSYQEIAKSGGGIMSTVRATRAASPEQLYQESLLRLKIMLQQGFTTIESKTGYGLDFVTDLKCLRVMEKLQQENPVTLQKTYLGPHAVPSEFDNNHERYVDYLCQEVLPELYKTGLVDAVDAFCDEMAFSAAQIRRFFQCANELGIPIKLHAEQFSRCEGAELARDFQALSADHLEFLDERGVRALAESGTTAVLLPIPYYLYFRQQNLPMPPVELLRKYRIPMAIATDMNPGTAPVTSPLVVLNMACVLLGLTPLEALQGLTSQGAKALGLSHQIGTIERNKHADLAIWNISHPRDLIYNIGMSSLHSVIKEGKLV